MLQNPNEFSTLPRLPSYDRLALFLCHLARYNQMLTVSAVETISAAYAMTMFAWTKKEAVGFVALAFSCMSVVEFGTYALFLLARLDRW